MSQINRMGAVKTAAAAKKRTVKRVNKSQPAEVLKEKQKARIRALLAEKRRQEQMRKEFELFLQQSTFNQNNNNNWYFPELERKRRSTRKLRR